MQQQEQELAYLRNRVAELEEQCVSHKDWIRANLEEAQQIIDNIVGIKGITEDPLKAAAELEAPYSSCHNHNHTHPPHEELYGY